jgi:hypothetical protein
LRRAGYDALGLKAFGQISPLTERFAPTEPAEVTHRWAAHNEWDIGKNFESTYFWLFDSATGRKKGIRRFPIVIPGSRDFGTVNVTLTHQTQQYRIKVYPKMVLVIKSFNSGFQGSIPKTLHGVHTRIRAAMTMNHRLTGKDDAALGGFRIEVTVTAISLAEAERTVRGTPFMEPAYWLGIGEGPHSPLLLSARLLSREDLLANANWIHRKAMNENIFEGANTNKPNKLQVKSLVSIFNALGWNPNLRRPTKSLDPTAWWNGSTRTRSKQHQSQGPSQQAVSDRYANHVVSCG